MASAIYPAGKEGLLGAVDLTADDIRVVCVDLADYTYSSAHDFLADVASAARVATSGALSGKTVTGGVFDASDVSIAGVTGDQFEALIVYVHTGVDATARLLAFIDTADGGGAISITPNGGTVTITWAAGGIFSI